MTATPAQMSGQSVPMPARPMRKKAPNHFGIETVIRKTSGMVVQVDIKAGTFTVAVLDERGRLYEDSYVLQFDDLEVPATEAPIAEQST